MKANKPYKIAPDFSMNDSEGRPIKLSDYKGKKNVMLVFNRGFQ
jgi:peroxiredoxin